MGIQKIRRTIWIFNSARIVEEFTSVPYFPWPENSNWPSDKWLLSSQEKRNVEKRRMIVMVWIQGFFYLKFATEKIRYRYNILKCVHYMRIIEKNFHKCTWITNCKIKYFIHQKRYPESKENFHLKNYLLFGSNMKKYGAERCIFQQYQFRPLLRWNIEH